MADETKRTEAAKDAARKSSQAARSRRRNPNGRLRWDPTPEQIAKRAASIRRENEADKRGH